MEKDTECYTRAGSMGEQGPLKEKCSNPSISSACKTGLKKKFVSPMMQSLKSFVSPMAQSSSMSKPFVSPLMQNRTVSLESTSGLSLVKSPLVKPSLPVHRPATSFKPPVQTSTPSTTLPSKDKTQSYYYSVLYCKSSKKKSKGPFEDGVYVVKGGSGTLMTMGGKVVSKRPGVGSQVLVAGQTCKFSCWDLEIQGTIKEEDYLSGSAFLKHSDAVAVATVPRAAAWHAPQLQHTATSAALSTMGSSLPGPGNMARSQALAGGGGVRPRHDPKEPGAVILYEPKGSNEVSVVIDPFLGNKLRPHQKDGVRFMYEAVMGLKHGAYQGCILADEMGLGKTLQVITLLWTLLKQGPSGRPVVRKAVVVCPSSLVGNWGQEVRKWLGSERLNAMCIHSGSTQGEAREKVLDFKNGAVWPLLIISYELVRKHSAAIAAARPGIVICDEGHRLKNSAGNKTIDALVALDCAKRIILTGTPIQNNLEEFYALMEFIAPNLMGTLASFRRLYAEPILAGRDRKATAEEQAVGAARSEELKRQTALLLLRRGAEVNRAYLPPKAEYIVFCRMSPLQAHLYKHTLQSQVVSSILAGATVGLPGRAQASNPLLAIGHLRKLSNHPDLLYKDAGRGAEDGDEDFEGGNDMGLSAVTLQHFPPGYQPGVVEHSGKLAILRLLLLGVADDPGCDDRFVVCSSYTRTLDVIESMCREQGWRTCRLDGSTGVALRQAMVNAFNAGHNGAFVFLLSSRAGGTGLNLIGANRFVLFDPDWNPSTDLQAMARVWREGQSKPVVIYRLLSTGSMDEKIVQRQIMKGEVAAAVASGRADGSPLHEGALEDPSSSGRHFSREELKSLFSYSPETRCDTYDLLSRSVPDHGWQDAREQVPDAVLRGAVGSSNGTVTFVQLLKSATDTPASEGAPSCGRADRGVVPKACPVSLDDAQYMRGLASKDQDAMGDESDSSEHDEEEEGFEAADNEPNDAAGADEEEEDEDVEGDLNVREQDDGEAEDAPLNKAGKRKAGNERDGDMDDSLAPPKRWARLADGEEHQEIDEQEREAGNDSPIGDLDTEGGDTSSCPPKFASVLKRAGLSRAELWESYKLYLRGYCYGQEDCCRRFWASKLGRVTMEYDKLGGGDPQVQPPQNAGEARELFWEAFEYTKAYLRTIHGTQALKMKQLIQDFDDEDKLQQSEWGWLLVDDAKREDEVVANAANILSFGEGIGKVRRRKAAFVLPYPAAQGKAGPHTPGDARNPASEAQSETRKVTLPRALTKSQAAFVAAHATISVSVAASALANCLADQVFSQLPTSGRKKRGGNPAGGNRSFQNYAAAFSREQTLKAPALKCLEQNEEQEGMVYNDDDFDRL